MLVQPYNTLIMDDNESFDDFYIRLTDIFTKLHANGVTYTRKEIVQKILMSLPAKFDNKRYAIEEMNDPNLTPELLSSKLRTVEMELEFKKQLTARNKRLTGPNVVFSSQLTSPKVSPLNFDLDLNEDCDLDHLDN